MQYLQYINFPLSRFMKGLVRLIFRFETCILEQSDKTKVWLFSFIYSWNKRLLLPRNFSLSGRLEEVCTTCWGLHWQL